MIIQKKRAHKFICERVALFAVSLILIISAIGCNDIGRTSYSCYYDMDSNGWTEDEICEFSPVPYDSVEILDRELSYDIIIGVRHNSEYKYKDLWLSVSEIISDTTEFTDTVRLVLADDFGKWKGKGVGGLYEFTDTLKRDVKFPLGNLIGIRHCMKTDTLKGIKNIGVIIRKTNS